MLRSCARHVGDHKFAGVVPCRGDVVWDAARVGAFLLMELFVNLGLVCQGQIVSGALHLQRIVDDRADVAVEDFVQVLKLLVPYHELLAQAGCILFPFLQDICHERYRSYLIRREQQRGKSVLTSVDVNVRCEFPSDGEVIPPFAARSDDDCILSYLLHRGEKKLQLTRAFRDRGNTLSTNIISASLKDTV